MRLSLFFSFQNYNFFLIQGPSCIRLNQSVIRPQKQQEIEILKEHKKIYTKVVNHLVEHYPIQRTKPIFQEYSNELLHHFHQCYYAPLCYKDQIQAQEQTEIAASIRKIIKRKNLIIRVTDKGNNFYIGSAIEFEQKVEKYQRDTNAFIELSVNPFNGSLTNVIQLLNRLRLKKFIAKWQLDKMMPDRSQVELAHLYFNPKTHKVVLYSRK
jgi:hypothetical protein